MAQAFNKSINAQPELHVPSGWRVKKFDSLESTNKTLRRIVESENDATEGLVIWAKSQTAGRGRMGRRWESPEGNLYTSILIKAPHSHVTAPQISFVTAVAVAHAILDLPRREFPPLQLTHKWPNDLLIGNKKVCGILPEMISTIDRGEWIVVGIGINLISIDIKNARYPIGSLESHNIDTTPEHILALLCRTLSSHLMEWRRNGFDRVRNAWIEKGPRVGSQISVGLSTGTVQGKYSGIDTDGALLLDGTDGRHRILAGDVLFSTGDS